MMLFEIGNVFARRPGEDGTGETRRLAMAATGHVRPVHWSGEAAAWDFYALKGALETLCEHLRLPRPTFEPGGDKLLFGPRSAIINLDGNPVGQMGLLDPVLARRLDIDEQEIFLLEIDLEPLLDGNDIPTYKPSSPYPAIRRDLSILVDLGIPAADLIGEVERCSALVRDVSVFDLYMGKHVPPGKCSLALSMVFQSDERTLKDNEADKLFDKILQRLVKKFGVQLR